MKDNKDIKQYTFTTEDFDACQWRALDYFVDVLNGEYDIEDAREDLFSLIGSEWDTRNIV